MKFSPTELTWAACTAAFYALLAGCGSEHPAGVDQPTTTTATVVPRLSRTIPLPGVGGPVERNGIAGRLDHMAYDAATDRLFLAAFSKGSLEVIDLKQGKLIKTVPGIPEAQGVAIAAGDKRVFVTSGDDGTLHVYDTDSLEPRGWTFVIEDADNVRFDARLRRILVGGGSKTQGAWSRSTRVRWSRPVKCSSRRTRNRSSATHPARDYSSMSQATSSRIGRNHRLGRSRQERDRAKMAIAGNRTELSHGA